VHTGGEMSRTEPRTPTEVTVAGVWKEVLGRSDFGVEDDFFACGGHSLAALRVLALIKERTGVTLKALDFFEHPTIAGFATRVDNRAVRVPQNLGSDQFVVRLRAGGSGAPVFMVPGGQGEPPDMLVFAALLGHLDVDRPMYGICSRAQDRSRLIPGSLEEQVREVMQAIEGASTEGPITLIGECAASTIAIALADRINARGRAVESLILLDPGPVAHLRSSAGRFADSPNGVPGALPPRVARRLAKYFRLLASWEPRPICSPLHVVLSSRFDDVDAISKSWAPLAQGGLHIHRTPGDHHTYIRDHAAQTAAVLTGILNAPRG
jgi:thioesterase domain-containing protein